MRTFLKALYQMYTRTGIHSNTSIIEIIAVTCGLFAAIAGIVMSIKLSIDRYYNSEYTPTCTELCAPNKYYNQTDSECICVKTIRIPKNVKHR